MTQEIDNCKEQFERWYFTNSAGEEEFFAAPDLEYVSESAQLAWIAWQAAWNTRAAQPVNEELLDSFMMRRDADAPANDTQEGSERYAQGWNDAINAIRKSIANSGAKKGKQ